MILNRSGEAPQSFRDVAGDILASWRVELLQLALPLWKNLTFDRKATLALEFGDAVVVATQVLDGRVADSVEIERVGDAFQRRAHAMGIRHHPISPKAPWQNECVERVIDSIPRNCLDHATVFGEAYRQRVFDAYKNQYNAARTHLSLDKNAPFARAVMRTGSIQSRSIMGGLHLQYVRV